MKAVSPCVVGQNKAHGSQRQGSCRRRVSWPDPADAPAPGCGTAPVPTSLCIYTQKNKLPIWALESNCLDPVSSWPWKSYLTFFDLTMGKESIHSLVNSFIHSENAWDPVILGWRTQICTSHFKGFQVSERDKTQHKLQQYGTVGKLFWGSEKDMGPGWKEK